MNISLPIWRAVIWLFLSCDIGKGLISGLRCYSISNLKFVLIFALLLLCHRDIEWNLGRKISGNCQLLKFCHWNLNIILSENFFNISLLKSFNAKHNFDFIRLYETFLSSSGRCKLASLNIDSKRGGVSCYFIESHPIRNLKVTPMTQCLVLEMLYNNKLVIAYVT